MAEAGRTASTSSDDLVRKAQVDAYVKWVNAQLRKAHGLTPIQDISTDLCDGIQFANLIGILSGTRIPILPNPGNEAEKLRNIQRVLKFMRDSHVRMHAITAEEIVEGDVKATLRMILALAAHYKPSSVRQQEAHETQQQQAHEAATNRVSSVAGIAQGASAALASARRDMVEQSPPGGGKLASLSGSIHSESATSGQSGPIAASPSQTADVSMASHMNMEQESLYNGLHETKKYLLSLQQLLLGTPDSDTPPGGGDTVEEELQVVKRQLQQLDQAYRDSVDQLYQTRQDLMHLTGLKNGLQNRLAEQEDSLLITKAELLRTGFVMQSVESAKTEAQEQLKNKDLTIAGLRRDLVKKDRELDEVKLEEKRRESTNRMLRNQMARMAAELERLKQSEGTLSRRLTEYEKKMSLVEGRMAARFTQVGGGDGAASHRVISEQLLNGRVDGGLNEQVENLHISDTPRISSNTNSGSVHNKMFTKLLCFADKDDTPIMVTIDKKVSEITLADVKYIVNGEESGTKRYFFKALDPEFGAVKEEIQTDSEKVPTWEGKVVVYLEEES